MATDRDFQYDLRPELQPLLLPVCALALGTAVSDAARLSGMHVAAGFVTAALVAVMARRLGAGNLAFVAILLAAALGGAWRASVARSSAENRPLRQLVDTGRIRAGDHVQIVGTLEDVPDRRPSGARLSVHTSGIRLEDGSYLDLDGRATIGVDLSGGAATAALDQLGLECGSPVRLDVEAADDLAFRNPGVETLRSRIRRNGYDLAARAAGPAAIECAGQPTGFALKRWSSAVRVWGLAEINAAFEARTAGILRALLLGDESHLDETTAEDYRQSGAYHVLVISGSHVALISGLCIWLTGGFTRSNVIRLATGAVPAWAYAFVLGSPAPVVRAALAVTVVLLAPLAGRRAPPPNTLALAAGVVLLADPDAIRDPSFQLTFAAVAAIVCIAAPFAERMADVGRWRPTRASPFPPVCSSVLKSVAEALFWDHRKFRATNRDEAVRFGVTKSFVSSVLSALRIQGLVRRVLVGLWIAVVIQLTLAPLAVTTFGRMTLIGTAWALLVEALLGVSLVAGLGFLAARAVAPAISGWLAWLAERLVSISNDVAAAAPYGWTMASPTGWSAVALVASPVSIALLAAMISTWHPLPRSIRALSAPRRARRSRAAGALVAVCLLSMLAIPSGNPDPDGRLSVVFLDVGQCDAAFVRFPDGTTMLVDAGGRPRFDRPIALDEGQAIFAERFDIGERIVTASLLAQGYARIDIAVATHGDVDHVGGFKAVMRRLSVGRVVIGAGADVAERAFARETHDRGIDVVTLAAGEAIDIGGARLEVVWPIVDAPAGNDGSLVFRLSFGRRAFLFTGDIEEAGETALIRLAHDNGWSLRADVLKVPHHGSRGASSSAFVAAVAPKWAVVSAPRKSPYGHPHAEAVARLRSAGAVVVQTGIDGAVGFTTDGEDIALLRIAEPGTQLLPPTFRPWGAE